MVEEEGGNSEIEARIVVSVSKRKPSTYKLGKPSISFTATDLVLFTCCRYSSVCSWSTTPPPARSPLEIIVGLSPQAVGIQPPWRGSDRPYQMVLHWVVAIEPINRENWRDLANGWPTGKDVGPSLLQQQNGSILITIGRSCSHDLP